jgi:acyl carrier protein
VHETDLLAQEPAGVAAPRLIDRVKVLLADVLGDPALAAGIDDDAGIVHDLGLDSIQMINFLLRLEAEFDIELEFEELYLEQVDSLRLLTEVIAEAGGR